MKMQLQLSQQVFRKPIRMPTDADFRRIESLFGIQLPEDYMAFMRKYAGHSVTNDVGHAVVEPGDDWYWFNSLESFYHLDIENDYDWSLTYRDSANRDHYLGDANVIGICSTSCQSDIALDYRKSSINPKIVLMDPFNAGNVEETEPDIDFVANSFTEFLGILLTEEEFEARYGPID